MSNVIVSLSAQQIVNNCYDSASLSNVFGDLFDRWNGPGLDPVGGGNPGQVQATR